ncbi:corticotropin-releasing factor-binding protein-like [Anneissia japonica]|uniref:corticotropin-releasing factor-binding protein-like n=1 Tax=Anneissia japonica TaxID=1529436 RepID=UPI001425B3A5|nr:corticotropin-releasing factor-binding protein-like [Anneissia japonica]
MIVGALVFVFLIIQDVYSMPNTRREIEKSELSELRKRSDAPQSQKTLDCFDMVGIEGEYLYIPTDNADRTMLCTVYFIANSMDELVDLRIRNIDMPCNEGGLQMFDGWNLGGDVFPSADEHDYPMEDRQFETCGEDSEGVFISSQNVAMISFPNSGRFQLFFRAKKNSRPCHAIAPDSSGEYNLLNYGERRNCSLFVIYPVKMSVIQMSVGDPTTETKLKCFNEPDQLQFLEGNGFDHALMQTEQVLCGSTEMVEVEQEYESVSRDTSNTTFVCNRVGLSIPLQCQSSAVRLISSGETENHVRVKFSKITSSVNECV